MWIAAIMFSIAVFAMPAAAATNPSPEVSAEEGGNPAADSGVVDVYRRFGLFGTFAADCSRPPTPANPHVTVSELGGGRVFELHDLGTTFAINNYSVETARRAGKRRLAVTVMFMPGTEWQERQSLIFAVGKGTRRTVFNRVEDGPVVVRRGIALEVGKRTPLLKKCG
jgi:hypothetical protein